MGVFNEWLHQQRNLRRLTRVEFANRVGCSIAMLRKIEDGERRPSTQIAEQIANALGIPPAEHETFVRVARGELRTDHISHLSSLNQSPDISPIQATSAPHNNLPVLPTPLIGRVHELNELCRLLRDPQCRLLTLIGPGGIGKTRLAIETAAQSNSIFTDGIYFIPLASINSSSSRFLVPAIADTLDFAFQSASSVDPKIQLFNDLKGKQVLLLVDNLEHLLTGSGVETFAELLANAPQVKLLTTSCLALELQGEWLFDVQGLPIPESERAEERAQDTSVELFLQRARRAYVGFSVKAEDYPAIVRICQLTGGNPLGIELAAAWTRTLTCNEIAQEIERGLDFLSANTREVPVRHRSKRAVFDHTWN